MERAWAYGSAIVNININTGVNYTIPEVKNMPLTQLDKFIRLDSFKQHEEAGI